jgi:hypothetical protein
MRTQLFIRLPKNDIREVENPNFSLGLSGWTYDTGVVVSNNVCFINGAFISQNYTGTPAGKYKLSFNVSAPTDGNALTGYLEISLGNWNYNVDTTGQHTYYMSTSFASLHDLIFTGQYDGIGWWNGGITNIQVESTEWSYKEIDLYDDVFVPITYNIADIKDITKRNSSYSKTITIPGTGDNNALIEHIYNLSTSGVDTMNSPFFCYLLQDSYKVFEGTLELTKCNIDNTKEISYEAVIYSQTSDFYKQMGSKTLRENINSIDDLDFSEYNHILTLSTIIDRQNDPVGHDVVYVPIDKQSREYSPWARTWKTDEFTPSLYIKEIWDKIFEKAGFTYTSTFLTSDFFKHLIYPHTDRWLRCTDAWAASKSATLSGGPEPGVDITFPFGSVPSIPPTSAEYTETAGLWTVVTNGSMVPYKTTGPDTGYFIAQESGYYDISLNQTYDIYLKSGFGFGQGSIAVWYLQSSGAGYSFWTSLSILRNTGITEQKFFKQDGPTANGTDIRMTGDISDPIAEGYALAFDENIFLEAGEKVYITNKLSLQYWYSDYSGTYLWTTHNFRNEVTRFESDGSGTCFIDVQNSYCFGIGDTITLSLNGYPNNTYNGTYVITNVIGNTIYFNKSTAAIWFVTTGTVINLQTLNVPIGMHIRNRTNNSFKIVANDKTSEGMLLQPTNILHKNIKQADFVTSIIKMFNLYMEPISDTEFIIEPRDDYYALSDTVLDWTAKVSTNNTIAIEQPTDIIKSIVDFKYDYDEDFFSKAYKDANYQREYGEYYKKEPKNTDDSTKYDIKLIFATAPNAPMTAGSKMEIPKLFKFGDAIGTIDDTVEFKPRILYYKGIVNTYTPQGQQPEVFIYSNQLGTQHLNVIGMFPYCGHFDNIYGYEQNDLLFGSNNWYWEITNPNWATWYNLFNKYYSNMINEYIDIDTKIVTMYIKLLPTDMENLRFYQVIYIDGIYYRLNKITDYVPGALTKVELLKIKKQNIPSGGFVNPLPIYIHPPFTYTNQTIGLGRNLYIDINDPNSTTDSANLRVDLNDCELASSNSLAECHIDLDDPNLINNSDNVLTIAEVKQGVLPSYIG